MQEQPSKMQNCSIRSIVEHLQHYLPAQGPIGVFIHHNTLHAFEHMKFEQAVLEAERIYGAAPYLSETAFRRDWRRGRILDTDVRHALSTEPNAEIVPFLLDRLQLRQAMMLAEHLPMSADEVAWCLEEGRMDSSRLQLFEACERLCPAAPCSEQTVAAPDAWHQTRSQVNPLLIRLCASYIDQGVSHWPMEGRQDGFLAVVRRLFGQAAMLEPLPGLKKELARQLQAGEERHQTIRRMLVMSGVEESGWAERLQVELLDLGGWAGLFSRLEKSPELAPYETLPCRLMDYLAVRMTLRAVALQSWKPFGGEAPASAQHAEGSAADPHPLLTRLFAAVEALGWSSEHLDSVSGKLSHRLLEEVECFGERERRRVWQCAFEYHHEQEVLGALAAYTQIQKPAANAKRPEAQIFFCIDEREESMRRHVEAAAPGVETLGAAGFFGVAVDYVGIDDAHGRVLCPAVMKPQHRVRETAHAGDRQIHELRVARRRAWAWVVAKMMQSSRALWMGWLSTAILGLYALFPLLLRVLAPRRWGQMRQWLNRYFLPEPRTEVSLMHESSQQFELRGELQLGFSTQEKADRVGGLLRAAGLRSGFARLVIVFGHGSTSLNNPHESAYDCGACGGRNGGPNARLFAAMANRPAVRETLRQDGLEIPDDTHFVGGCHDTASDGIEFFDLESIPSSHRAEFASLKEKLEAARAANALERCRRFESARGVDHPAAALRHAEERAEHLAEPRTECGHGTNAVCFIGRRAATRGLFLDRRCFLVSYDNTQDPGEVYLSRLLSAAGPVCAGISLEYYFSRVDNQLYGCGTKLPHNVTGLVGVMDGYLSDLRTGLPAQMVEIHEPLRILFVVEASVEGMDRALRNAPGVAALVRNRWVRLATIDPQSGEISVYREGQYEAFSGQAELPAVSDWREWYRGQSENLGPAILEFVR
jgi:uncharacterized protein